MSVENASLQIDAAPSAISITAGTDVSFTPDGVTVANGKHLAASSVADFRVRPSITVKTKNPSYNNGTFSKGKREISVTIPKILADGTISYTTFRASVEAHPECSTTETDAILALGCQTLFDADFTDFFRSGSLA